MSDPLLCGFTPTCNRPELLGRMIKCFERQNYENRFLVIVDDLGQYSNQKGDRWELVSIPRRCLSLGEKNNIAASLAPRDTFGLLKMDDDDFYYPWHFEAHADALVRGEKRAELGTLVQPRLAIDYVGKEMRRVVIETFNRRYPGLYAYHGGWSMTRRLFCEMNGYSALWAGDDGDFQERFRARGRTSVDTSPGFDPSYEYNRPLAGRISERGGSEAAYWDSAPAEMRYVGKVPEWTDESDWLRPIPTERIERQW